MGKKRVIKQTEEAVLKEKEEVESKIQRVAVPTKLAPKAIKTGVLYISSTYNNTYLTLTDPQGNVLTWVSAGKIGFKGTKKGTPYAAAKAAEVMAQTIEKLKLEELKVKVKGFGTGRESALRTLAAKGVNIVSIEDITPIPHNGCKRPKPRRV
jgi:small subunit ribosomal protein S11